MKQLDFNRCPFRDICFIHRCLYSDSCIQTSLQMIEFKRGETLFQQGSPAVGCYVLCRGKVKLLHSCPSGKRFLISIMVPGDLIGEEGFFHPSYFDWALALETGIAVFITRDQLHTLLLHYPDLTMELAASLSRRCDALCNRISAVSWYSSRDRLVILLLDLGKSNGEVEGLSQTDLSYHLGITRATVNEHLQELELRSLIAVGNRRISLLDRVGLQRIIQTSVFTSASGSSS